MPRRAAEDRRPVGMRERAAAYDGLHADLRGRATDLI
jgi:hypothetical protein